MSIVKAFNDHFESFVEDIIRVFPNNTDILASHSAFLNLRRKNPKLILTAFHKVVAQPYATEIDKGDISFFIQKDYGADVYGYRGRDTDGWIIEKIDTLRGPVGLMSEEDQTKVMKYIQNLAKLSNLYVSQ